MKRPVASLGFSTGNHATDSRPRRAFTLIEIMVVIGILGLILTMGAPPFFRILQPRGMSKAVSEVQEVCSNARAQAILKGTTAEVVFHPLERRFEAVGLAPGAAQSSTPGSGQAGRFPDDFTIEMLDINLLEYRESDVAHVRFFPNGTSDEMTLIILRTDTNERRAISLEVTTGLATILSEEALQKLRSGRL
jgi:prepilin-type N-terminal cleavage/methylation domain-containing protein